MKTICTNSSPFIPITMIWLIMVLSVTFTSIGNCYASGADDVSFSEIRLKPGSGESDTEFAFTVRITTTHQPNDPIEIVVQGDVYEMDEVNPGDSDFSDGKDYQFSSTFEQGPQYYFIRCGKIHTRTYTFYVGEESPMEYHPDLALAMIIYAIPVIYLVVLMRRFTVTSKRITTSLKTIENGYHAQHMSMNRSESLEREFPTIDPIDNRTGGGKE